MFFALLHLCLRLYECNYGRVEPTVLFLIDSSVHKPAICYTSGAFKKVIPVTGKRVPYNSCECVGGPTFFRRSTAF